MAREMSGRGRDWLSRHFSLITCGRGSVTANHAVHGVYRVDTDVWADVLRCFRVSIQLITIVEDTNRDS